MSLRCLGMSKVHIRHKLQCLPTQSHHQTHDGNFADQSVTTGKLLNFNNNISHHTLGMLLHYLIYLFIYLFIYLSTQIHK